MLLEKQYTPGDYARMAWRRRWFIIVPFVVGLFVTLLVSSRLPNQYQSEMLIQVVPQRVPDSFVESTVTLRTEDRINALSQQAMSRTVVEQLIETFALYTEERDRLPMAEVVERMRDSIEVEVALGGARGSDAEAFYVRFTYPDASLATRVTGRVGAMFIDQNARDRSVLSEGTSEFLETQLALARDRLGTQERRLELFREQHVGRLPDQLEFNMQAMQNTQIQLQAHLESVARDRDRKLMLERLHNDAAAAALATDEGDLTAGTAEQGLALARTTLAALERRFRPEHPDVIRTKRVIEGLKDDLEREAAEGPAETPAAALRPGPIAPGERLQQMRAEIESLGRQIEFKEAEDVRLRDVIGEYERRIEAIPGVESEWIALSRDYDTQQEFYRELLSKNEHAKVSADLERRQVGEQFRVLDSPQVPVVGLRWHDIVAEICPSFLAAAAMSAAVCGVQYLAAESTPMIRVSAAVICGAVTYLGTLARFDRSIFREIRALVAR